MKTYFGRVLRKIIHIVDPILPARKEIIDILQTPIRLLDQVMVTVTNPYAISVFDADVAPAFDGMSRFVAEAKPKTSAEMNKVIHR